MPPSADSSSPNVLEPSISCPSSRGDHLSPSMFSAAAMHPERFSTLVQGAVSADVNDIIKIVYHKVTLQSIASGCIVIVKWLYIV